jgi:hypothetical protein
MIFFTRPLSAICLGIAAVLLFTNLISFKGKKATAGGRA